MKNYIVALLYIGCLFPLASQAQTKAVNHFYKDYKKTEGAQKFTLPGWIIDLGAGIGKMSVESEEEKEILKLVKKINKIKVLSIEAADEIKQKDLNKLYRGLEKESFEKLIQVKDGNQRMNLMIREKKGRLKNFVLVAKDEGEFILVSIKSKISMNMLNALIKKLNEDFEVDMLIPEEILEEKEEKLQV